MADNTHIEWADATVNPIRGCTRVSEGCANCYAVRMVNRLAHIFPDDERFAGLVEMRDGRLEWTGKLTFDPKTCEKPLHWRKPRRIFWNSLSDTFGPGVDVEWITRMLDVMYNTPRHLHLVLTKRPDRMEAFGNVYKPMPNVILMVSAENQARWNERVPSLLKLSELGWRVGVSVEPMLGPIDTGDCGCLEGIIVGGESGPGARPMHLHWARSIRDQCAKAGMAFMFKQWGEWRDGVRLGKKAAGRTLDGRVHDSFLGKEGDK